MSYELVRLKIEDGTIKKWDEIFLHIPSSVVAVDMGIEADQWATFMQYPGTLNLVQVFDLAGFFGIPSLIMFRLIGDKVEEQEQKMTPRERQRSEEEFMLSMARKNVDLPALIADIKQRAANLPK